MSTSWDVLVKNISYHICHPFCKAWMYSTCSPLSREGSVSSLPFHPGALIYDTGRVDLLELAIIAYCTLSAHSTASFKVMFEQGRGQDNLGWRILLSTISTEKNRVWENKCLHIDMVVCKSLDLVVILDQRLTATHNQRKYWSLDRISPDNLTDMQQSEEPGYRVCEVQWLGCSTLRHWFPFHIWLHSS